MHTYDENAKAKSLFLVVFLKVAEELRQNVYKATGLTCSAGVAANRLLAKVL